MKKCDLGLVFSEFVLWTQYVRSEINLANVLYLMCILFLSLPVWLIYVVFQCSLISGCKEFSSSGI
jgi:hypothetical protein